MLRLAFITALVTVLDWSWVADARADGFDSLINLELAFRDAIMDKPAPNRYRSLIRDGETTITFVRNLPDSVGKTDFSLNLDWKYDYRIVTRMTDAGSEVSVTPMNVKLTTRLRHLIRMPVAWYHAEVWESRLLAHEFDHVAVSLDPRPRVLLVHLCSQLPTQRFLMVGQEKPSEQQIREGINREIHRRQSAIIDLLRANYAVLDKVSRNGQMAIQDRRDFFDSLYTPTNLKAAKFTFQREVAPLVESESYRQLRPRHVAVDPATRPQR